eukprot:scaffold228884_cov21-Tisochrysis_lutea.AAC.2
MSLFFTIPVYEQSSVGKVRMLCCKPVRPASKCAFSCGLTVVVAVALEEASGDEGCTDIPCSTASSRSLKDTAAACSASSACAIMRTHTHTYMCMLQQQIKTLLEGSPGACMCAGMAHGGHICTVAGAGMQHCRPLMWSSMFASDVWAGTKWWHLHKPRRALMQAQAYWWVLAGEGSNGGWTSQHSQTLQGEQQ